MHHTSAIYNVQVANWSQQTAGTFTHNIADVTLQTRSATQTTVRDQIVQSARTYNSKVT